MSSFSRSGASSRMTQALTACSAWALPITGCSSRSVWPPGRRFPVLIVGEPGTGKRQVARAIHQNGPGRNQPLVPFDSEALPAEVLERELFAALKARPTHARPIARSSAETTAIDTRRGLDALDPRDLHAPPRLAGAAGCLARSRHPADRAPPSSTPRSRSRDERIRPDLYYAVTTLVIRLRPLRERRDELPLLAQHLLERANQRGGTQRSGFSPEALAALLEYDWPGNLTELARVIDHAHAIGGGDQSWIAVDDLPASIRGNLGAAYLPPRRRAD